jgi:hypothetical protein
MRPDYASPVASSRTRNPAIRDRDCRRPRFLGRRARFVPRPVFPRRRDHLLEQVALRTRDVSVVVLAGRRDHHQVQRRDDVEDLAAIPPAALPCDSRAPHPDAARPPLVVIDRTSCNAVASNQVRVATSEYVQRSVPFRQASVTKLPCRSTTRACRFRGLPSKERTTSHRARGAKPASATSDWIPQPSSNFRGAPQVGAAAAAGLASAAESVTATTARRGRIQGAGQRRSCILATPPP